MSGSSQVVAINGLWWTVIYTPLSKTESARSIRIVSCNEVLYIVNHGVSSIRFLQNKSSSIPVRMYFQDLLESAYPSDKHNIKGTIRNPDSFMPSSHFHLSHKVLVACPRTIVCILLFALVWANGPYIVINSVVWFLEHPRWSSYRMMIVSNKDSSSSSSKNKKNSATYLH